MISVPLPAILVAILKRKGIPHNVLNAKNHANEAKIISRAGDKGAITIATNMAGRGTDIKLTEEIKALGGLKVIGSERHDSVRVDNQLRGRSGRQGDPGESIFFVSLEDEMTRNYISDRFKKIVSKLESNNGHIDSKSAIKAIENAQKSVEGDNLAARKNVVGYDDTLNKQREVIYEQRNQILESDDIKDNIIAMIKSVINVTISSIINNQNSLEKLLELNLIEPSKLEEINLHNSSLSDDILEYVLSKYSKLEDELGYDEMRIREKSILLDKVDELWIDYLNNIEIIRQGVNLKSYKQVDPVQLFILESSELFNEITYKMKEETVRNILSNDA